MKIRNKINFSFIAVFIFTAALICLVADLYSSSVIKNNIYSYLHASGRARAEHIRTFIQDQENTSVILAAASVYRDFLKEPTTTSQYKAIKNKIDKRLVRTKEADSNIYEVFIMDNSGKIVASSDKAQEGSIDASADYFTNGKTGVYFKDVYFSNILKIFSYTISAPVLDDNGALLGVSILRYLPSDFFSIFKSENGLGNTEENFLINKDKFFITPSRFLGESVILKQKVETTNSAACFDPKEMDYVTKNGYSGFLQTFGSQIVATKDYRNIDVVAVHSYIPETNWCLITKVDQKDILDYRFNLILFLSSIFIVALLVFLFIGILISRKIVKPIKYLQLAVAKVKQGDFNQKVEVKTNDEIEDLAKGFNTMLSAVKQSRSEVDKKVKEQTRDINNKSQELEGQKQAVLNILEDVEKEKSKIELLVNDLEKFKLAVENASDQVVITDIDGIVLYGNKMVEKITGYTVAESIGKKAGSLWHLPMTEAYYKKFWDIIKNKKQNFNGEIKNRRKNGEEYIAAISVSPVLDKAGQILFFVGLERDITQQKEIDQEKTEFVSLASHQLKTPVGSISWNLEMLQNGDYGPLSSEQKEIVAEMYGMNQRMNELINSLLNVSRIEMGVFVIDPTPVKFTEVCEDVLDEMKPRIIAKGHEIVKKYSKDLPIVPADKNLLRIIFQNFISNAIKYTPEKGKIKIAIEKKANDIVISVCNNGAGVPEKDKTKIFSKLFRASNAQDIDPDGNGIGLYLVKKIVENGGGKIWFESVKDKETTFYVSFPLSGMVKKEGTKALS
ncbi:MAG: ATP-binding protein [Candidatus Falkowbacteria bacterium]|nr:ATP-binding protein [Candidatus Falkowbacteria bacterium]